MSLLVNSGIAGACLAASAIHLQTVGNYLKTIHKKSTEKKPVVIYDG